MATKESVAIVRDTATQSLKESGEQIAAALKIAPPAFDFFFKDKELHQAEELKALAAFNQRVAAALRKQGVQAAPRKVRTRKVANTGVS